MTSQIPMYCPTCGDSINAIWTLPAPTYNLITFDCPKCKCVWETQWWSNGRMSIERHNENYEAVKEEYFRASQ